MDFSLILIPSIFLVKVEGVRECMMNIKPESQIFCRSRNISGKRWSDVRGRRRWERGGEEEQEEDGEKTEKKTEKKRSQSESRVQVFCQNQGWNNQNSTSMHTSLGVSQPQTEVPATFLHPPTLLWTWGPLPGSVQKRWAQTTFPTGMLCGCDLCALHFPLWDPALWALCPAHLQSVSTTPNGRLVCTAHKGLCSCCHKCLLSNGHQREWPSFICTSLGSLPWPYIEQLLWQEN